MSQTFSPRRYGAFSKRITRLRDDELRVQRLAGVPRGTHRLASSAFRACEPVEQLLPREVLDFVDAEDSVFGDVLHVDLDRTQWTKRERLPAEHHVERRREDVH